jgi:hypothetical protein
VKSRHWDTDPSSFGRVHSPHKLVVDCFIALQSALPARADADKAESRFQNVAADRYGATWSVAQEPAAVLNDVECRRGAEATSASSESFWKLETTGADHRFHGVEVASRRAAAAAAFDLAIDDLNRAGIAVRSDKLEGARSRCDPAVAPAATAQLPGAAALSGDAQPSTVHTRTRSSTRVVSPGLTATPLLAPAHGMLLSSKSVARTSATPAERLVHREPSHSVAAWTSSYRLT